MVVVTYIDGYMFGFGQVCFGLHRQEGEDLLLGLVLGGELGGRDLLHLVGLDLVLRHWWTSNWSI